MNITAEKWKRIGLFVALPLAFLAVALWLFVRFEPMQALTGNQPPVEELTITRVVLGDDGMAAHVVNGGPEPVTIAQVQVDEAYWSFGIESGRTLERLERAIVHIPYHWVQGEAHEIRLVTQTGATFDYVIDVAMPTPRPQPVSWLLLGLVGAFVGIIPVGVGLATFPVMQHASRKIINFLLALTVGLLVFLFFDTLIEGIEIAETVAGAFEPLPLLLIVGMMSFLALTALGQRSGIGDRSTAGGRRWVALAIAIGIGLHNLGEGLVVGAAIATGAAALGSFLVVGFVLHNITEGIAIGAPMADDRPGWKYLVLLVLVAGGPAIFGMWLGGFSYDPLRAVIFFGIGAGAILQVIVEVGNMLIDRAETGRSSALSWINTSGIATGVAVMYATALLV